MDSPSVGRIVHYVSYGTPGGEYKSRCVAAIITDVRENPVVEGVSNTEVRLKIFNPDGDFNSPWLKYNDDPRKEGDMPPGGTWHWPERK